VKPTFFLRLICIFLFSFTADSAFAVKVRLAKQFGISFLPLVVMEADKLLEAEGKKLGIDIETEWLRFAGGAPMNEALLSGDLDLAAGGVGPLLIMWDKTRNNLKVKGVAALNAIPIFLNTINPDVRSLRDLKEGDRIAVPAIKVSAQAIILQMAAAKEFGDEQFGKLDPLTVSMSHPDAQVALLSGKLGLTAHFCNAPYVYDELNDSRVRTILKSNDVLGGPHTLNAVWTSTRFAEANPRLLLAFLGALEQSMKMIHFYPQRAAQLWLKQEKSTLSEENAVNIIVNSDYEWTMTPKKVMVFANFMNKIGVIQSKPAIWTELFFENIKLLHGD
jgi:NitT/TauT family transport system substrate-binding protein